MRDNRGTGVIVLLLFMTMPSCSPYQGEVALRAGEGEGLQILYYPCSTRWHATRVHLYDFRGQFLGDEDDRLITSTDEIGSSAVVGEDAVLSQEQRSPFEDPTLDRAGGSRAPDRGAWRASSASEPTDVGTHKKRWLL
jgi:hypothetical protein